MNESKLSIEYVPKELPHREKKIRKLTRIFKGMVQNPGGSSKKVLITGGSGTGKTATAMRFGELIQGAASEKGIALRYAHVNCRLWGTEFIIVTRIIKTFNPNFPRRGFTVPELWGILYEDILKKEDRYLLLALDNFEYSLSKYPQLIYNLTRVSEDSLNSGQRISFITIAKDESFTKLLDPSVRTTFQCSTIPFEQYTNLQLDDILNARIREAFDEGTVLEDAVKLISDFGAETGDCRYALELLWLAGKFADEAQDLQINAEHVRRASSNIHPHFKREILETLSFQNQIILLAICNQLESTQKGYAMMGDCESAYHRLCANWAVSPYKHTQLWASVQWIADTTDLISREVSALGNLERRAGRSTIIRLNYPISTIKPVLEKEIDKTVNFAIESRVESNEPLKSEKRTRKRGYGG